MVRYFLIAVALAVVLMVFCAVDAAMISRLRIRGLPRWAWLLVIILVPVIGPVLWLLVGRAKLAATIAPDDDPTFLADLKKLLDEEHGKPDSEPKA